MAQVGSWTSTHTRRPEFVAENKIDPDDGNSTMCIACRLPIFSTPFITIGDDDHVMMHDQCAANDHHRFFPAKLEAHPLHSEGDLILHQQHSTTTNNNNKKNSCSRCGSICGTSFYKCHDPACSLKLDLACALPPMNSWILHRSHPHRLTAIKGKSLSSLFCDACGAQHQPSPRRRSIFEATSPWQVSHYMCIPCDFWIHPDCAILPNAIHIDDKHHPHPLTLTYPGIDDRKLGECAICNQLYLYETYSDNISNGLGRYECLPCGYTAHIKCAVYSDPRHVSFKPVKIRDAQVPGLLRLPMPNETTSVMAHILTKTAPVTNGCACSNIIITIVGDDHPMSNDKIHEHPLILRDHDDIDIDNHHSTSAAGGVARVCNACVQLIYPPDPFYTCNFKNDNECRDFFLHKCCTHLPMEMTTKYRTHRDGPHHQLILQSKVNLPSLPFNMFKCAGCGRQCNGFAYKCMDTNFYMDVVCAFMYTSIMHANHAKSHILCPLNRWEKDLYCICCGDAIKFWSEIIYQCKNCRGSILHAKCALLPDTVIHKFDRHPLKLITPTLNVDLKLVLRGGGDQEKEQMFCEIFENDIDDTRIWYYGCKECDQYFHTDCIPCLDGLSKIKFGFKVRVSCHDCPLTCVRALSVDGYRCQCGCCERRIIREADGIAFECSECYFRMHKNCVCAPIVRSKVGWLTNF